MLSKVKAEVSKVWESLKALPTAEKVVAVLFLVCVAGLVAVAC